MNESLKPTLLNKLKSAQKVLQVNGSQSARLDTLILAELSLKKSRTWILANPDYVLSTSETVNFDELIARRSNSEPIAYILGRKEFYGREFVVSPGVLIPRPETEKLIEIALGLNPGKTLDVGTGSGAIAVTLALETNASVVACDISSEALKIASKNAKNLKADVEFVKSDLLSNIVGRFDLIVANLPYVDKNWQVSSETQFEPNQALFADDFGLALIKKMLDQAPEHLTAGGYVLLEADPRQHELISDYSNKFKTLTRQDFSILLQLK